MITHPRFLALAAFVPAVVVAQQAPAPSPTAPALTPPVAAVRAHRFDEHGTVRTDSSYWLRERSNPEVMKYLEIASLAQPAVGVRSHGAVLVEAVRANSGHR